MKKIFADIWVTSHQINRNAHTIVSMKLMVIIANVQTEWFYKRIKRLVWHLMCAKHQEIVACQANVSIRTMAHSVVIVQLDSLNTIKGKHSQMHIACSFGKLNNFFRFFRCIDYDECAIATHKCSHQCRNIDGSYLCECPDGLILASDQHTCVSEDFCANDNGGCSDTCNVVNGQVTCSCLDGAELDVDGKTCRRKNICASNNGGCAHICNVELNICECNPGFETFDDGKTCRDLNECLQNNGGCPQQCINAEGDFQCTCFDGFVEDEQTGECRDRNECEVNNGNCDHECTNTEGSYICSCRAGYRIDANQHQCFDTSKTF